MTDMTELAERIEALDGPCREVDAEIFKAIGAPLPKAAFGMDIELRPDPNSASGFIVPVGEMQVRYECPAYTASLDAAMTLVPEPRIKGEHVSIGVWTGPGVHAPHVRASAWVSGSERVLAATPALALCAAALRAKDNSQ